MLPNISRGFSPPLYPFDRLGSIAELAKSHHGRMIDLSVGTPIDAPIDSVIAGLSNSKMERGYPTSLGSRDMRREIKGWLFRRFDLEIDESTIAGCIGTKEFVASAPWYLKLRNPAKDTVLYPSISYPTYAFGAQLAQCRAVPVSCDADGRLDLDSISTEDLDRALMLWSNSPSNPTGHLDDLHRLSRFAKDTGITVFSDECYAEYTWTSAPDSILNYGTKNVISVHSLSKRSNLAGLRVGFYTGDQELVQYLALVRQHAGMMIPGPAQYVAAIAFSDDEHVERQREIYHERLEFMLNIFRRLGYDVKMPEGGFYLWFRSALDDGFELASELARKLGILVAPGEFYGESSSAYVRVAMVAEMKELEEVASRSEKKVD